MTGTRERAFTTFTTDSKGSLLFACDTNNRIHSFSLSNFSSSPVAVYESPEFKTGSFFVKLSVCPNDEYLASGNVEENTFVWPIDRPEESYKMPGHYKEVTAVDWTTNHRGDLGLVSCGEDGSINFWEESPSEQLIGFGQPTYHCQDRPKKEPTQFDNDITYNGTFLENLPSRLADLENIRPSTPPNLIIPSSFKATTCKKSVISDYFPPLSESNMTEHLLRSLKTSPFTSGASSPRDKMKKRPFNVLPFFSPLRPPKKLPKNDNT